MTPQELKELEELNSALLAVRFEGIPYVPQPGRIIAQMTAKRNALARKWIAEIREQYGLDNTPEAQE